MPVEVAKAMLNEESEKKEESFENVPSLMTAELPDAETSEVPKEDSAAAASSEEDAEEVKTEDLFY